MSNPENQNGISFDTFEELVFARRAVGSVLGENHALLRHQDSATDDAVPYTLNDLLDMVDEDTRPLPHLFIGESERAITKSLREVARKGPDEASRKMAHIYNVGIHRARKLQTRAPFYDTGAASSRGGT